MIRRAALLAAALTVLAATAASAAAQQPSASLPDIEDEVMCPICGTALNLSESPQASRERDFIRRRIDEGLSKEEIKDALVAEYGSEVLASPEASGFDLAAWVVPGLAIVLAGGALVIGVRRWRAEGDADPGSPPDGPGDGSDGDQAEAERKLEADLSRYEL